MRKFRNIILVALPLILTAAHPLHVSVSDVEFVADKQELQIIVRVFTDDLEKQIRLEQSAPDMDILQPGQGKTSDQLFEPYLKKHLNFKVNGKEKSFSYLGHEVESGAVVSYLLINNVKKLESLEVKNDILLDVYDDQVNLVHVSINDDIHTMKFIRGEDTQSRSF